MKDMNRRWVIVAMFWTFWILLNVIVAIYGNMNSQSEKVVRESEEKYIADMREIMVERCVRYTGRIANGIDGRVYHDEAALRYYRACLKERL